MGLIVTFGDFRWGAHKVETNTGLPGVQLSILDEDSGISQVVGWAGEPLETLIWDLFTLGLTPERQEKMLAKLADPVRTEEEG